MKKIKLSKGKVVLVDDEDFEYLSKWKWFAIKPNRTNNRQYAARTQGNKITEKILLCIGL